jgi:hypothetical protein
MMRLSSKMRVIWGFLLGALVSLLLSLAYLSTSCTKPAEPFFLPHPHSASAQKCPQGNTSNGSFTHIACIINGDRQKPVACQLTSNNDVLVPFTFLEKYFEISGKVETGKKSGTSEKYFNWQHSYAKLIHPKLPYEPDGIFMSFDNYNGWLID